MAKDDVKANPPAAKCPLCNKDWKATGHDKKATKQCPNEKACKITKENGCGGTTNIGNGGKLEARIAFASDLPKKDHPMALRGGNLQAHHLVCSEALNDEKGKWARICQLTGYNINCYKNGVRLPSELEQACGARVPLHKGGHAAGFGGDASSSYPKAVMDKVDKLLKACRNSSICSDPKELKKIVEKLNTISEGIFNKIKDFKWTITWDGFDYQDGNPIGCSNVNTISAKRGKKEAEYSKEQHDELAENREKIKKITGEINTIDDNKEIEKPDKIKQIEEKRKEQDKLFEKITDSIRCKDRAGHTVKQYNNKLKIGE